MLRAKTTEPLSQAEQSPHNGLTASSFSCCTSRKISLQRKTNQPPPHTSSGHQLITVTLVPGATRCDSGHSVQHPMGPLPTFALAPPATGPRESLPGTALCRAGWKPPSWRDLLCCCLACYLLPQLRATERQFFLPVAQK